MGEKEGTQYSAHDKIWKKRGKNSWLAEIVSEIEDALLENERVFKSPVIHKIIKTDDVRDEIRFSFPVCFVAYFWRKICNTIILNLE
jgi:hypothetical protein